jgi:hypothetical protein
VGAVAGRGLSIDLLGDELTRRVLEGVAPELTREIRESTERVMAAAEAAWPVGRRWRGESKPHSRDLFTFRLELRREGGGYEVVGRITNSAAYLRMIRPLALAGEPGRDKVAFVHWLWEPMRRERERIVAKLPPLAVRGLSRG